MRQLHPLGYSTSLKPVKQKHRPSAPVTPPGILDHDVDVDVGVDVDVNVDDSSGQIGEQWYVIAAFDRSRLTLDGTQYHSEGETENDRMQECHNAIHAHLQQSCDAHSPLLRLWESSYVDGRLVVLPHQAATDIAKAHPRGYHNGLWHLVTEYEAFCACALLTNSNPRAPGHGQPKSFSAWPRRHNVNIYRRATVFRADLSKDVSQTSPADRATYLDLVSQWHQSVEYISYISGDTRLDQNQMEQLCVAIALSS